LGGTALKAPGHPKINTQIEFLSRLPSDRQMGLTGSKKVYANSWPEWGISAVVRMLKYFREGTYVHIVALRQ